MGAEKWHPHLIAFSQRAAALMGGSQHGPCGVSALGCGHQGPLGSAVAFPQQVCPVPVMPTLLSPPLAALLGKLL